MTLLALPLAAMDELYGMPGHLVRRVQQIHAALFAEECAAFDLTSVQYAALVAIAANPEVDATRLSALIGFDRSTLGDVLERLEAKGWVARAAVAGDRRVKRLALSPEGLQLLCEVTPAVRRVQARLVAPLKPGERATLARLLGEIANVHNDIVPAPLRAAGRR